MATGFGRWLLSQGADTADIPAVLHAFSSNRTVFDSPSDLRSLSDDAWVRIISLCPETSQQILWTLQRSFVSNNAPVMRDVDLRLQHSVRDVFVKLQGSSVVELAESLRQSCDLISRESESCGTNSTKKLLAIAGKSAPLIENARSGKHYVCVLFHSL